MDTELFVHFAEIAGVFVGFGALIALRSEHRSDVHDPVYLRSVMALGVWVVVFALLPVAVGHYGVDGPVLWRSCAALAVVVWAVLTGLLVTDEDNRALWHSDEPVDRFFPVLGLPMHLTIATSLVLVLVGPWPQVASALYVTALTTGILFAGYTLLALVLSQAGHRRPRR